MNRKAKILENLAGIIRIEEENKELIQKYIEAEHPYQIGTIATSTGHSHKGKKLLVRRRDLVINQFKEAIFYWTAHGPILKKNGEPGMQHGEWVQRID